MKEGNRLKFLPMLADGGIVSCCEDSCAAAGKVQINRQGFPSSHK